MIMDRLLQTIRAFDGVLELTPEKGSTYPEVAWDDHFFYFSPDGQVPEHVQPYATVVTKNYPDDTLSDLDRTGRWRLNIHVGVDAFVELTGERPGGEARSRDYSVADVVLPHPVYRQQGWIAIVNPGPETEELAVRLLASAHHDAERRARRRATVGQMGAGDQ
jgi:hypothetical protein